MILLYKSLYLSIQIFSFFFLAYIHTEESSLASEHNPFLIRQPSFKDTQDFKDANRGFIAPLPHNGIIKNEKGEVVWDLQQYQFLNNEQNPNDPTGPTTVNLSLWRQARLLAKSGLFKVSRGIYQIRGADLSNMTIIEGKSGIIIVDPLLSKETARASLDLYYQHRSKVPVKAVIYTHSHSDHFGGVKGVISQEEVNNGTVKVIAPAGFTEAAFSENIMAGNVMGRRAMYMYGSLIQPGIEGQMTSGLGLTISTGEITLILPTDLIFETGQSMTIDGIEFVFLMAPGSEAPAEMLFYLPHRKTLCAAEDATHNMHNLYTLRGAKIRNAKAWAGYLNQAIEMFGSKTKVIFAQHHWPRWGRTRIIDFLEKQRDMYKFIHDQSLHFANQGYTMVEIGEMIQLPDSLAQEWYNRGYYGTLNHNAKSVYAFYLGWFDGNPSTLHPLPERDAAKKYVEYMGGSDVIIKKAIEEFDQGNFRWVSELLNHVVFADPTNQRAKNLLADTLEQLGYMAENATWRNFYLTGASELRFGVQRGKISPMNTLDVITSMSIEDFLDYLAIRIDGMRAAKSPMSINLNLTDINKPYLIEIKNGVLNYFPGKTIPNALFTLSLKRSDLHALLSGNKKITDLIESKEITLQGNHQAFETFQSLFDTFEPWFDLVQPQ